MRDYTLQEISTGRVLGTVRIANDVGPGELVLAFRRDLLRVSEVVEVGVVAELDDKPAPAPAPASRPRRSKT
jgi:hypothetical protein